MRVVLRPTVAADIAALGAEEPQWRIKAITATVDDRVIGIGGLAWINDNTVAAFVAATPEAYRYPVAFHRAGLMTLAMARRMGITTLVAMADPDRPAAERWLERLGFTPLTVDGEKVYRCSLQQQPRSASKPPAP